MLKNHRTNLEHTSGGRETIRKLEHGRNVVSVAAHTQLVIHAAEGSGSRFQHACEGRGTQ